MQQNICFSVSFFCDRAGELTEEEITKVKAIIQNPRQYDIPDYFLNRRKDMQTGKHLHLHAHQLAGKFREDLQRWKKTRFVCVSLIKITHGCIKNKNKNKTQ